MKLINKKVYFVMAFIWMGIIFYMSNQPASISSQQSGGVIETLNDLPYIGSIITYMMEIDIAEFIIRKAAHMFSYFILAILLFMSMYDKKVHLEKISLKALVFTFLYALSDEFHQLFIEGRSGEFRDVMIDTSGGFIGILILYFIIKFSKKSKSLNKQNNKVDNQIF